MFRFTYRCTKDFKEIEVGPVFQSVWLDESRYELKAENTTAATEIIP